MEFELLRQLGISREELNATTVPQEILDMAEEIADGADGIGIEPLRLKYLLRCVLAADRRFRRE